MTHVFLDANVLFSAAYREGSGIARSWRKDGIHLVTSPYARTEAERNIQIKRPEAVERHGLLISRVEITMALSPLSDGQGLPPKDQPILAAAVGSGCSVLLTGDIADFGHLIGTTVEGVQIMTVSMFLTEHPAT